MSSNQSFSNLKGYEVSNIAEKFHELPHLNFKIEIIKNSTFDYENKEYLESLILFVILPLTLLIVILLLFFVFSIFICCNSKKIVRMKRN
jgi:hypothetical protein